MATELSTPTVTPAQHELSSYWTLWAQIQAPQAKGGKPSRPTLGPIFDFNTVEDFWTVYNSLKPPSELTVRHDVIFLRSQLDEETSSFDRVQPEWEDLNNIEGGEYRFTLSPDPKDADKQWELTLLAVLGGSLPCADQVSGVWLGMHRKSGSTLSLWKRSPDQNANLPEDHIDSLALAWMNMLKDAGVPVIGECHYVTHKDAIHASKAPQWQDPQKKVWRFPIQDSSVSETSSM